MTLETNLCGLMLQNPLIAASGTFGYGKEFSPYVNLNELGAMCSKGITLNPRPGNAGVRMWETPSGMMNSIGLQNPGIQHFIDHELKMMRKFKSTVIANLGGGSVEEYVGGATLLDCADIDMIELNISCPNVREGGVAFGIKAEIAHEVVSAVRAATTKPLMVKLSPNAENITEMAKACVAAGADALSLINTLVGMAIDVYKRKPVFNNTVAGLSGPAVRPVALRMVYEVVRAVDVPVVGLGGIMCGQDVVEFIMAGATAVQIGTGNLVQPNLMGQILAELTEFMQQNDIESLDEIRGCAQR